jgi:hypothetical protein
VELHDAFLGTTGGQQTCSGWSPLPADLPELFTTYQVVTYEGVCEQFYYQKSKDPLSVDQSLQAKYPRTVPWLKPTPSTLATPQDRFKTQFFLSNRTGGHV